MDWEKEEEVDVDTRPAGGADCRCFFFFEFNIKKCREQIADFGLSNYFPRRI